MPHRAADFFGRLLPNVIELRTTNLRALQYFNLVNRRRVERKDALHPYPVNDAAHRECRARLAPVLPRKYESLKRLQSCLLFYLVFLLHAFNDFLPDAYSIPGFQAKVFALRYIDRGNSDWHSTGTVARERATSKAPARLSTDPPLYYNIRMKARRKTGTHFARMLTGGVVIVVLSFFAFALHAYAQELAETDPAVARDARRVEDLQTIKKALDAYATYYWFYPRYDIRSAAMSDAQWRRTIPSRDFRKRLKPFLNQLPIDPLNDPMLNFRYVYGLVPVDDEGAPDCAGKTVLFATRVETDAAHYQECDLGGAEKRILYIITSEKKTAAHNTLAGVFMSFAKLFSFAF